jgi:hypothetical protein
LIAIGAEDVGDFNARLNPLSDSSGCAEIRVIGMCVDD